MMMKGRVVADSWFYDLKCKLLDISEQSENSAGDIDKQVSKKEKNCSKKFGVMQIQHSI